MEKDIKNWILSVAKSENKELPKNIKNSPLFKNYFWKSVISVLNDPRVHQLLKNEIFLENIFSPVMQKISLLDDINGQNVIDILFNDKKYANYAIANYLLKKPNNELINLYNKNSYPFTTIKEDYNSITVLPLKLLDDFFEHAIKKEIDSENTKENRFYDITSEIYLELINSYIHILDNTKYPSFYNQLKSMFSLIDILYFDEKAQEMYNKTKKMVAEKNHQELPFITTDINKNILVSEFEYILLNANKYFTKIVLNGRIRNSFFDVINSLVVKKDKNTILPSTEKLIAQMHENLQKEVFYFEKFENKRFKYTENVRSAESIMHINSLIEKLNLLYNVVKNDAPEQKDENKKTAIRRRI